jgi:short-subunit dehydrogenase involved in D-alanine esterification of teichoic acids
LNSANLALIDVNSNISKLVDEISSLNQNVKISTHICDVSDSKQVNNLFSEIKTQHPIQKVPNVILNSAGITRDRLTKFK